MGNKGAYIKFNDLYKPEYFTFDAVPHPEPIVYARDDKKIERFEVWNMFAS
jgi:hypothetical protein